MLSLGALGVPRLTPPGCTPASQISWAGSMTRSAELFALNLDHLYCFYKVSQKIPFVSLTHWIKGLYFRDTLFVFCCHLLLIICYFNSNNKYMYLFNFILYDNSYGYMRNANAILTPVWTEPISQTLRSKHIFINLELNSQHFWSLIESLISLMFLEVQF